MTQFRMPSADELYALDQVARLERSRTQAALVARAARSVRELLAAAFARRYAAPRAKVVRHA